MCLSLLVSMARCCNHDPRTATASNHPKVDLDMYRDDGSQFAADKGPDAVMACMANAATTFSEEMVDAGLTLSD